MRRSAQREAIWDWIRNRHDHPTAEQVYEGVRTKQPKIGLATVYRNLLVLQDQGKVQMVDVGDGVAHFDPLISHHPHFKCQVCGKVMDVPEELELPFDDAILRNIGDVDSYSLCFYGTCTDCR